MAGLNEMPKITGEVFFKRFRSGVLVEEVNVTNLVVTAGLNYIAGRMVDGALPTQMTHMALGSSNTSPLLTDTQLGTQLGSRVALTGGKGTVSGNTVTYTATFPAGGISGAIVEAGIFNAATSGTMLCRTTFPVINKGSEDTLAVIWVITVS